MPSCKILSGAMFALAIGLAPLSVRSAAETKCRLFILSGQSNMVGLSPETSFLPALRKAFPNDELIVVKSAQGGQPIRRWFKDWKAPDGADVKAVNQGDLYRTLLAKVQAETKDKSFHSVSFVWMQGERDARERLAAVYAKSLQGLIELLRKDLKRPDMTVVIGRLSDCGKDTSWEQLRAAQVHVASKDSHAAWVDTDDLNGPNNALHYTKDGYRELGQRFADKTVELLQKN